MRSATSGQTLEDDVVLMAKAAIAGEALTVRALALDLRAQILAELACPTELDAMEMCVAAGLIELLAERTGQAAPSWTRSVPPSQEPFFLVRHALSMPRLRHECEQEGPAVLRARNLFAPINYLTFA
ncbi:hypothetical protein GC163_14645 [bacterium]|nr:hypothetical protein [bacterium]